VKYVRQELADHLMACIKEEYEMTVDWSGDLYCGVKFEWDYLKRMTDILMPGWIQKLLLKYAHNISKQKQGMLDAWVDHKFTPITLY
jgi:hypothetical protein